MKKSLNQIVGALLCSMLLFSCENELEKVILAPGDGPSDVKVDTNTPLVCSAENAKDTAFVITWAKAGFGENISAAYTLQIDVAGNNFATPQEVVVGNNVYKKHLTSDNLNTIMHKLGQPIDVATDLDVRVMAKPMVLGSSEPALTPLYSPAAVKINVTSYAMAPLHLIGSMFGAYGVEPNVWDITNYRFVMFRNDPLSTDEYTGFIRAFSNVTWAGQFKFMNDGDLNTYTMYGKKDANTLSLTGGNFELPKDGYYTIVASTSKMTYSIKEYDASKAVVYTVLQLSGSGVASTVTLTQAYYDKHIWTADDITLTTGELTFQSGTTQWSAKTFPFGKGSIGGENIKVTKAGKYFIKFNDLTGHYVFYQKK